MATFSFDRPLELTAEEAEKFLEIAAKPAKPDNIKPYHEEEQKKAREMIKRWFESQKDKE